MKGITNAPQGSGGGSGGDWTQVTGNDWSDVFEVVDNKFHVKKDALFVFNASTTLWTNPFSAFIPKGTTCPVSYMSINFSSSIYSSNKLKIFSSIDLNSTAITATYLNVSSRDYTFTTDGSSISVAPATANVQLQKTNISLYTRD